MSRVVIVESFGSFWASAFTAASTVAVSGFSVGASFFSVTVTVTLLVLSGGRQVGRSISPASSASSNAVLPWLTIASLSCAVQRTMYFVPWSSRKSGI